MKIPWEGPSRLEIVRLPAENGPRKWVGPCVAEILPPEDRSRTIKISFFSKNHCFGLNLEFFNDLEKKWKNLKKNTRKNGQKWKFRKHEKKFCLARWCPILKFLFDLKSEREQEDTVKRNFKKKVFLDKQNFFWCVKIFLPPLCTNKKKKKWWWCKDALHFFTNEKF